MITFPLFSQAAYLELNLNNRAMQNRLLSARPGLDLELFRVIDRAGKDTKIRGIVLNISAYNAGQETLWELRNALEQFKSRGKKVCAFISGADLDLYCLASVADRIVMDEQGTLALTGYVWGRAYALHSLEKLGIGVRELRYLEYKSAAETFTRDAISEADRKQYGEWLDDIFTLTRNTIIKARSWTPEFFDTIIDNEFLYSAKSALGRGLVDRTGRDAAIIKALEELEGMEAQGDADPSLPHFKPRFVLYGDPDSSLMESKALYGPGKAGGIFSRPPVIAVIYANGQTDMERGMAARSLARTIREVSRRKRVRAMVIRINSPGGSAEAADYVAEAVVYAKVRIPVVVSMGGVAASGGYWASLYANHITATPYTLTGSIGVIGSWFYDKGLNSKLGLTVDVLQRGAHADMTTGIILTRRDLTAEEEARYRTYILDLYNDFVVRVAAGRGMELERVNAAAQGRVYSGQGALDTGLIDSIGGLTDAVRIARDLAGIPETKKIAYAEYPKPRFIDKVLERFPIAAIFGSRASVPGTDSGGTAAFLADLFLPAPLLSDLRYRLERNGQVMPILPLESRRLME